MVIQALKIISKSQNGRHCGVFVPGRVENRITWAYTLMRSKFFRQVGAIAYANSDRPIAPPAALEAQRTQRGIIFFLCRETTAKEKFLSIDDKFGVGKVLVPAGLKLLLDRRLPVRQKYIISVRELK
jgi:hypothetical protein